MLQDVWPHQGEYSCLWDIPSHTAAKQLYAVHKGPDTAHGAHLQAASHMSTFLLEYWEERFCLLLPLGNNMTLQTSKVPPLWLAVYSAKPSPPGSDF